MRSDVYNEAYAGTLPSGERGAHFLLFALFAAVFILAMVYNNETDTGDGTETGERLCAVCGARPAEADGLCGRCYRWEDETPEDKPERNN